MHAILQTIAGELDQLALQIAGLPASNPFGIAHGNWTFPSVTSEELRERVEEIARDIRDRGKDVLDPAVETRLADYPRRITFLRTNTVPQIWGNAAAGVFAFTETIDGLIRALKPALQTDVAQDASSRLNRLRTQVSGLETRLKLLQPKAADLEGMVRSIEETYTAAQELPATLEYVQEANEKINKVNNEVSHTQISIDDALAKATTILNELQQQAARAKDYIDSCESAYRTSVGKGLAEAFQERSTHLNKNMWGWVFGLVISLISGIAWSSHKISDLVAAANSGASPSTVVLNGILATLSVAAPIWLGWLATRQIGQSFRLAEDYAFKASVARSYEGYRKEAKSVDDSLVAELLSSAIRRVDEEPLRVVEAGAPGSPWHDLARSPAVAKALQTIPEFGAQIRELANKALQRTESASTKPPNP